MKNNIKVADLITLPTDAFGQSDLRIDTDRPDKFNHKISINVTKETFESWLELREKIERISGFDNESKAFEFAVIEALNVPDESLI